MKVSSPEIGRLRVLSFTALAVAIAGTVFVSVIVIQLNARSRLETTVTSRTDSSDIIGQPVSSTVLLELAGVSAQTLSAVGKGPSDVTPPTMITSSSPLVSSGKPEVLYVGGEFCPFCAAERWPLIVALSRFGNFTGLEYMRSASLPEVYPNTSTFTFADSNYTSAYLVFVPVESQNRTGATVRPLASNQSAVFKMYDTTASIPFVDFGNKYVLVGSQVIPSVLRAGGMPSGAPYNWSYIGSQLDVPGSTIGQNIDGAANRLISAICNLTGGQPASVCSQGFAKTLDFLRAGSPPNTTPYVDPRRLDSIVA